MFLSIITSQPQGSCQAGQSANQRTVSCFLKTSSTGILVFSWIKNLGSGEIITFSPGLNAGRPLYGQVPHRNASPNPHCNYHFTGWNYGFSQGEDQRQKRKHLIKKQSCSHCHKRTEGYWSVLMWDLASPPSPQPQPGHKYSSCMPSLWLPPHNPQLVKHKQTFRIYILNL